jgi:hypothetical protein
MVSGSRPSFAMEKKMRGRPMSITRMTEDRPVIAPRMTSAFSHDSCGYRPSAVATGSGVLSMRNGAIPVRTRATAMYSTVQTASEPRMPIGMSRCGFFASPAAVDTASKPTYEKNTMVAARKMPPQPNVPGPSEAGMNGCQLAGLITWMAKARNSRITVTLIVTMIELTNADCVMPT